MRRAYIRISQAWSRQEIYNKFSMTLYKLHTHIYRHKIQGKERKYKDEAKKAEALEGKLNADKCMNKQLKQLSIIMYIIMKNTHTKHQTYDRHIFH